MATVAVTFTALPAHVRTARFIAAAVARRAGVAEDLLDEVRLAVGEACSRAVHLHRRHAPREPIEVRLTDGDGTFLIEVIDRAPGADDLAAMAEATGEGTGPLFVEAPSPDEVHAADAGALPATLGLAVITGLADHVSIERDAESCRLSMSWRVVPVAGGSDAVSEPPAGGAQAGDGAGVLEVADSDSTDSAANDEIAAGDAGGAR